MTVCLHQQHTAHLRICRAALLCRTLHRTLCKCSLRQHEEFIPVLAGGAIVTIDVRCSGRQNTSDDQRL